MAASVEMKINTAAGPSIGQAETSGVTFGLTDAIHATTGTAPPIAAGTVYSWYKTLHIGVLSGGGTTSLLNRQVKHAAGPSPGLTVFWKDGADTYTQATDANNPADNGTTNDATPAGWTAMTASFAPWDASSEAAVNATRNGNYIQLMGGVSFLFTGGGGANSLPTWTFQYQEE